MKKTIFKDWLEKEGVLENFKKRLTTPKETLQDVNPKAWIARAFVWDDTPERHTYWGKLSREWDKYLHILSKENVGVSVIDVSSELDEIYKCKKEKQEKPMKTKQTPYYKVKLDSPTCGEQLIHQAVKFNYSDNRPFVLDIIQTTCDRILKKEDLEKLLKKALRKYNIPAIVLLDTVLTNLQQENSGLKVSINLAYMVLRAKKYLEQPSHKWIRKHLTIKSLLATKPKVLYKSNKVYIAIDKGSLVYKDNNLESTLALTLTNKTEVLIDPCRYTFKCLTKGELKRDIIMDFAIALVDKDNKLIEHIKYNRKD